MSQLLRLWPNRLTVQWILVGPTCISTAPRSPDLQCSVRGRATRDRDIRHAGSSELRTPRASWRRTSYRSWSSTSRVAAALLNGPNVVTALRKVDREGLAEGVATHTLVDAGRADGAGHGTLNVRLVIVMSAFGGVALHRVGQGKPCHRQWRDATANFRPIASGSQTRSKPAARSVESLCSLCSLW